jgi:hypothetical protein
MRLSFPKESCPTIFQRPGEKRGREALGKDRVVTPLTRGLHKAAGN